MGSTDGRVSAVGIADAIADARRGWRLAGDDLIGQETWAVYSVLGELLEAGPGDDPDGYVAQCRDLAGRLVDLDVQARRRDEQKLAAWIARTAEDRG